MTQFAMQFEGRFFAGAEAKKASKPPNTKSLIPLGCTWPAILVDRGFNQGYFCPAVDRLEFAIWQPSRDPLLGQVPDTTNSPGWHRNLASLTVLDPNPAPPRLAAALVRPESLPLKHRS